MLVVASSVNGNPLLNRQNGSNLPIRGELNHSLPKKKHMGGSSLVKTRSPPFWRNGVPFPLNQPQKRVPHLQDAATHHLSGVPTLAARNPAPAKKPWFLMLLLHMPTNHGFNHGSKVRYGSCPCTLPTTLLPNKNENHDAHPKAEGRQSSICVIKPPGIKQNAHISSSD